MKISDAARNAMVDAITALINTGGAGHCYIRSGAAPTNTGDADSGTLLATLTFSATAFGAASSGVATAYTITSDTNVTGGTAAHFRVKSGAGTVIWQGTVTATGGGGDLTFNTVTFVTGGTCSISSWTVTQPAS